MSRFKVGDLVHQTPQSPGRVREVLPGGAYKVEWLTRNRGMTVINWASDFTLYVENLGKKYRKYEKKLMKLRNRP